LVRDVISGVFYLMEDAFRVGELVRRFATPTHCSILSAAPRRIPASALPIDRSP
jgi:hypothetical protein